MRWRATSEHWGWITISIHWLTALAVLSLFALGLWMVELDYYHGWYRQGPHLHKSIGVLVLTLTLVRLLWRRIGGTPTPVAGIPAWQHRAAVLAHVLLYILLLGVTLSGYLISTADGRAVEVFNWFELPATLHGLDGQEDIAGTVHLTLAITLISLAGLHALAALKHHVLDKDRTLRRMLGL